MNGFCNQVLSRDWSLSIMTSLLCDIVLLGTSLPPLGMPPHLQGEEGDLVMIAWKDIANGEDIANVPSLKIWEILEAKFQSIL